MTDEQKLQNARRMYDLIRGTLEHMGVQYGVNEERMMIRFSARGEDLPMEITMAADLRRQMVVLLSPMPVEVNPDRVLDMAVAVAVANNTVADGGFDYDLNGGRLFFRMNNSFIDCSYGEKMVLYMIDYACHVIDRYNERFEQLGNGTIDLGQFIDMIHGQ